MRRPRGSPLGMKRRTNVSFTSTTCGAVFTSAVRRSRPRKSGIPIVSGYPGVAQTASALGDWPGG